MRRNPCKMQTGEFIMFSPEKMNPAHPSVVLHTMRGNKVGDVPFYIRCYTKEQLTKVLHQHEMFQINYVKKGSCYHYINQKESEVVKGDILIIPPYVPHQFSARIRRTLKFMRLNSSPILLFRIYKIWSIYNLYSILPIWNLFLWKKAKFAPGIIFR